MKNDKKETTLHQKWFSPKNDRGRPYLEILVDVVEVDESGRAIVEFDIICRDIPQLNLGPKGETHDD